MFHTKYKALEYETSFYHDVERKKVQYLRLENRHNVQRVRALVLAWKHFRSVVHFAECYIQTGETFRQVVYCFRFDAVLPPFEIRVNNIQVNT